MKYLDRIWKTIRRIYAANQRRLDRIGYFRMLCEQVDTAEDAKDMILLHMNDDPAWADWITPDGRETEAGEYAKRMMG